ncbi:conserved Plasmodium protein, unknown function [Plasmodium knowlesi strain H]|uniref:Uncharacterized protein n=3 Tax=Plasmodium knowlesi TaxID=5850 RepID=A0A1A7W3A4_PLAKH|nr:conserved Plasmodium protein, unknown function [Plasmodium knowlesi strain H]OTN65899.1 Uncharacterized protein PKNOH_S100055900 [Plasmodium knowlesi]CAA9987916.1 conserved Plasmodium protein, unknown function [Plasmodium knowlesi strain H]SBO22239.1 conserved Plasmodium protein, unknown function [Plasmodium knowlesi strain H]SBO28849.1 conserved Plasmodium protein, unknown function [Plasmodium knowlesi strain H]VVS77390.1 conserved Plasmodium protein, unknown function [Plasmodium knowlesi 
MYCLLKNALNFDKFKNIKIDLINKVKASDSADSHEENAVFNLLKDKELFSEGLQLSRHNSLECTSSVKKKLKHINNLKRHLNDITNIKQLEKCRLYKETGRDKTIPRKTVGVSSFLKNGHGDCYDDKSMEMFNSNVPLYGEIKRMYKDVFCKTVSRRIQKKGLIRKTYFKTFMFKFISELNSNSDRKHIDITKFELTNGKLIAYLHCYKKCSPEKVHHVRNVQVFFKKKIYYKSIITKKSVSSVKRNKQMQTCLRRGKPERHSDDRNQVKSSSNEFHSAPEKIYTPPEKDRKNEFNNYCADNCEELSFLVKPFEVMQFPNKNAANSAMAKWNCLQPSADRKEFHKNTGRNDCIEFVSMCGEASVGETVNTLIEGGYKRNLKIDTFSNLGNGELKDLKKNKEVFEIHNSENIHKSSSNQKNINLSELRRVSNDNQQNNKKEFKRIRDPRVHFLSNNVNFYETVINEEKCKAENTKKGDNISDENLMQNGEMNEIKNKIKTALINLNNIRKNNYKLKFCLEKEIIDNTIHQNELKSLGSVFSENSAHKKSAQVDRNSLDGGSKNVDKRRNSRHDGDKQNGQKVKMQREENAQNVFFNNVRSIGEKVTVEEKGGSRRNSTSSEKNKNECLHSTEEGAQSTYSVIKNDQNEGKTKLVSKTEAKRKHFKELRGTELVQKHHTNGKQEQKIPKSDIKLSNREYTLNGKTSNKHVCSDQSLKDEEKSSTLNNTPKVHTWEVVVQAEKNALKNNKKEEICGIDEKVRSSFLGHLKSRVEKVEVKEMDRKNEYSKVVGKHKNLIGVKKSTKEFKENNSYADRNKSKETIKNIETNDLNGPLDDDKRTHNIVANSRDCTKKYTASQEILCDEGNKERKQFDLSNVRNIKKIITCGIYVNKEVDRINKRNKIAITMIENYLESTNKTCSFFSKQKEKNTYLQKDCIPGREYEKKETKKFPGVRDHYAFLLLNVKNCKVV